MQDRGLRAAQVGQQQHRAPKRQHTAADQRVDPGQGDQAARSRDDQEDGERHPRIAEEHADQLGRDLFQQVHRIASMAGLRASAEPANPAARKIAAKTNSARSCPGQSIPKPSPVQNTPKADSITPTPNFKVFSGTRESGRWTIAPTRRTSAHASSAPRLAGSNRPPPAPTAITINTTSRPSSRTPFNAVMPAIQSSRA